MLKTAENSDIEKIQEFYKFVADNTENMDKYGRWIYGQHPTNDMIEGFIQNKCMYFAEDDGMITASAAVTFYQNEDYHLVQWNVDAKDDEVAVIHILCINLKKQGCGLAKSIMKEIIALAKTKRMKAVRLDALCCNTPAHKLYEGLGFVRCGIQNWYASNTGYIVFYLYELVLDQYTS